MSIDELGRAAAEQARRAAAHQVNAATMFHQLRRRNRVRTAVTTGVVLAVCVAAVVSLLLVRSQRPSATPPATTHHRNRLSTVAPNCQGRPSVQCRRGPVVLVSLPVPVTIHAPANFHPGTKLSGRSCLDAYRNDDNGTGVTVIENAVPVRYDDSWKRDPSAGTTVSSMTRWLSSRPFLTHTSVKQITVDGFSARRVSGELKPRANRPAFKDPLGPVAPTFASGECTTGYAPDLFGNYTLLAVPGAGVTVIWSWTTKKDHTLIAGNQSFINGLSFG